MKNISILGSTGSIGVSALDVIIRNPSSFKILALSAGKNLKLLQDQIDRFKPKVVSVIDQQHAERLIEMLGHPSKTKILWGDDGYREVATLKDVDMVLSAIVGAAGLVPTFEAIDAGKDIALANKETMVMAGSLVVERAKTRGVKILPVDSEHGAIFQCLEGHDRRDVRRIILTASGGPFLYLPEAKLAEITLVDALKHPNWEMGRKITIDSASMMNKGLEVIEAKWLFNIDVNQVDVLIHPQSIVHSMVEYKDGSVIAQLAVSDMKGPIAYALSYPERLADAIPHLDLCDVGKLEFLPPDVKKFANLRLAYLAIQSGGTTPAVLSAANEVAVEAFIEGKISFIDMPEIIKGAIHSHQTIEPRTIDDVLSADRWGRAKAIEIVERISVS
jgi:1-deoxy-D-xylulose-5-phosphate reductoisomerase